jgi:hypothetical protein
MAAATIASTKYHNAGDMQFVTANLTSVADTNTWDTGLGEVDNVIVSAKSSGTPVYASWTSTVTSGKVVVTFEMSGTGHLTVTAIGR